MSKTCSTPGKARERSPKSSSHKDGSYDGTDTDHYIEPDAEKSADQPNPDSTKHCSTKYDLRHILRATMLFRLGQLQNRSVFTMRILVNFNADFFNFCLLEQNVFMIHRQTSNHRMN